MKLIELVLDGEDVFGIDAISLVENPAIKEMFVAFEDNEGKVISSGGRYDLLARTLGSPKDYGASGFSIDVMHVINMLKEKHVSIKNKDKIFGMYKTFHFTENSRGLGLFITKNQMEAMGGWIEVESEVNKGSKFNLYFKKEDD